MEHKKKLLSVTRIPIRWGDMDAYGHVNNTVYFRFMEQGRCQWFEDMNVRIAPVGIAPVIISTACTFKISMTYPGTAVVYMYAGAVGRSSLNTYVELRVEGDERIYAEGTAKIVWMDMDTGKSAPIPANILAVLQAE